MKLLSYLKGTESYPKLPEIYSRLGKEIFYE